MSTRQKHESMVGIPVPVVVEISIEVSKDLILVYS
jgi:hypothetical protein